MSVRDWVMLLIGFSWLINPASAWSEVPGAAYVFPAGGQRGTTVDVRIGGHFLYEKAELTLIGSGVTAGSHVERTKTLWLEGPVIPQPASQQKRRLSEGLLRPIQDRRRRFARSMLLVLLNVTGNYTGDEVCRR